MSTFKSSVGFSTAGKRDLDFGIPEALRSSQMVPGPGNYNKESGFNKKSTYSFAKSPRMKDEKCQQGDWFYSNVRVESYKKSNPKFSLSKTNRPQDLFINLHEGSQFFSKSTDGFRSGFPGPGKYEADGGISKVKPRTRSVILLKSTKDIDYNNKIPGPGSYDNDTIKVKSAKPKWTVAKTIREDPFLPEDLKKKIEKIPGPGNYNFSTLMGTGRKVKPNLYDSHKILFLFLLKI
jgi:hypothetical protein